MASVEESVYYLLSNASGLTALVGKRIYPVDIPEGEALPAISWMKVGGVPVHAMGSDPGPTENHFQIDVHAETYSVAKAVANSVKIALSRKKGRINKVTIQDVFFDGDADGYDSDTRTHQIETNWTIWEAGPLPILTTEGGDYLTTESGEMLTVEAA